MSGSDARSDRIQPHWAPAPRADWEHAGALNGSELRSTASNGPVLLPRDLRPLCFRRSEGSQRPRSHRRGHWSDPSIAHNKYRQFRCPLPRAAVRGIVAYVDNDPLVLVHARALLTSHPGGMTGYVDADVRDRDAVLRGASMIPSQGPGRGRNPVPFSGGSRLLLRQNEPRPSNRARIMPAGDGKVQLIAVTTGFGTALTTAEASRRTICLWPSGSICCRPDTVRGLPVQLPNVISAALPMR